MPFNVLTATLAVIWALAVLRAGVLGQATSPAWVALIAVAVLPMVLIIRSRHDPMESMSKSIQQVLR